MTVLFLNLPAPGDDTSIDVLDMLRTVFGRIPKDDKRRLMRDKFNIEIDNVLMESVDRVSFIYEDGYGRGFAEGIAEGETRGIARGRSEERERHIQTYVDTVLKIAERVGSVEEALSIVRIPDDCIDEVRTEVRGRCGHRLLRAPSHSRGFPERHAER